MSGLVDDEPVLDANGHEVPIPAYVEVTEGLRAYMAGKVPAPCGHYIAAQEARAGFTSCEVCS